MGHVDNQRLQTLIESLHRPNNDVEIVKELYQTKPPVSTFEEGCRCLYPPKMNLFCRYNFTTTPFLRLAPLKLEEINLDPYVVMYHEVLYESEIEELKKQSVHMKNGYADQKNGTMFRSVVARHSWWSDESPTRERINQRIKDMTGLDFPYRTSCKWRTTVVAHTLNPITITLQMAMKLPMRMPWAIVWAP